METYRKFIQTLMEETLKVLNDIHIAKLATNPRIRASESAEENAKAFIACLEITNKNKHQTAL